MRQSNAGLIAGLAFVAATITIYAWIAYIVITGMMQP
jgi:hypothetical protein